MPRTATKTLSLTVTDTTVTTIKTPWDTFPNWASAPKPGDVIVSGTQTLATDPNCDSITVLPGGKLTITSPTITARNLLVMEGGELNWQGSGSWVMPDLPLSDPWSNSWIILGKVRMLGIARDSWGTLTTSLKVGDTMLHFTKPVSGWQGGDKLYIPDSKQWAMQTVAYVPEWEEAVIGSISPDGLTVTLTAPLQFNHPGGKTYFKPDATGNYVSTGPNGIEEYFPVVGNRTRSITVRSASAAGTRGIVYFSHHADVDVRYTAFAGLGRTTYFPIDTTNIDNRYPVAFSHISGPANLTNTGYQYTFIGNAVFCPMMNNPYKWGIAMRDSHYGLIQDNFIYNWAGSGLMAIQGNESFNVIDHNLSARGLGKGDRDGGGNEGCGFWFRGPNNRVTNNIATNFVGNSIEAAMGFKPMFVYLGNINVPKFRGADMTNPAQYNSVSGNAMPLLEFSNNEVFGMENGFSLWWLNSVDIDPQSGGTTTIKNMTLWNIGGYAFYGYPMSDVIFDGMIIRNNKDILGNNPYETSQLWFGDYMTDRFCLMNSDIQGLRNGIITPYFGGTALGTATTKIVNTFFANTQDIVVRSIGAPGSAPNGAGRKPKSLQINNCKFGDVSGWRHGGITPSNIKMLYTTEDGCANLVAADTVLVTAYNGVTTDNFQVFYTEQAADASTYKIPNFTIPQSAGNLYACPEAGLSNEQMFTKYTIALAGAVAPVVTVPRNGIIGLVK